MASNVFSINFLIGSNLSGATGSGTSLAAACLTGEAGGVDSEDGDHDYFLLMPADFVICYTGCGVNLSKSG